jgi:hypothetical protein
MSTGLPNSDPLPPAPINKVMEHRYHRVSTKTLIGVAVALCSGVVGSAPASADPTAFSTLRCNCHELAPAGSPVQRDEIARGVRQGLSDVLPEPRHQLSSDNFRP